MEAPGIGIYLDDPLIIEILDTESSDSEDTEEDE